MSTDKLVEALEGYDKFLRHGGLCGIVFGYGYCTCGLDAAKDIAASALVSYRTTPRTDVGQEAALPQPPGEER